MATMEVNEFGVGASSFGNLHQNDQSIEPDNEEMSESLIDGFGQEERVDSKPYESGSDDDNDGDDDDGDDIDMSDIHEQVPLPPTPVEGGLYSSIPFFNTTCGDILIDSIDIPKKKGGPLHMLQEQALEKLRITQEDEDDYDSFKRSFSEIYTEFRPHFR
ncbi:hypothetical protein DH2020_017315 [Rehmannia glutinosa]|uniref:Uncharacterized protein n=1 Tax=Rehmannia glutinosa TaxID=99300 RepID=A0ABR0WUS4_REHGL